MTDCAAFYRLRDRRTVEYLGGRDPSQLPLHLAIDTEAASCASGQLALLALANQLSRVNRRISVALPDPGTPIMVRTPFTGATLGEVLLRTVRSIDPCGSFVLGRQGDPGGVSIGLGERAGSGFDWYIGADRAVAFLSRSPVAFTPCIATLRGAAAASCLGAAALFREQLRLTVTPRVLSAWNYAEGPLAGTGPDVLEPLNVGRVLLVGAGAVAASLMYWLYVFGVSGDWTILDKDTVRLHNTNRGLIFTAAHAGWPSLTPRQIARKAQVLADLMPGARALRWWYDECETLRSEQPDVILGLANDRNVRHLLAARSATVTLHATTSANWQSQLHRHITGRDDCICCRAGDMQQPVFGCSNGIVTLPHGQRTDAALPFLSAASGLMLATSLHRLQAGELARGPRNDWRWDFNSPFKMATSGVRRCSEGCRRVAPGRLRRRMNARTRWHVLDGDGLHDQGVPRDWNH